MRKSPAITVLMCIYNGEKYLKEAIDSMISQSFKDYEFSIINDGSTDNSREIILSYNDPRIKLIDNERNVGLARSLNKGIEQARGKYIARMDADDISINDRLLIQASFLDKNPDIGIVGSNIEVIDIKGNTLFQKVFFEKPILIKWGMFFGSPIAHPTVMIRSKIFKELGCRYNEEFFVSQDYELWISLFDKVNFANVPKSLLKYRSYDGNKEVQEKTSLQEKNETLLICKLNQDNLNYTITPGTCLNIRNVRTNKIQSRENLIDLGNYLYRVSNKFINKYCSNMYEKKIIRRDAKLKWYRWCVSSHPFIRWKALIIYLKYKTLIGFDKVVLLLAVLWKATLTGKYSKR